MTLIVADNLKNGRFHLHLRETFAPMVVRYVDLMESSIGQSIHKGFERERWENKGWVSEALLNAILGDCIKDFEVFDYWPEPSQR